MNIPNLNQRILAVRKLCGLSRQQMGDRLGFTKRAVCRWELEGVTPQSLHRKWIEKGLWQILVETAKEIGDLRWKRRNDEAPPI